MSEDTPLYTRLAAAYVRGKLRQIAGVDRVLLDLPLESLDDAQLEQIIRLGRAHELRLHRFKRTMGLPRVAKVLGVLKAMRQPSCWISAVGGEHFSGRYSTRFRGRQSRRSIRSTTASPISRPFTMVALHRSPQSTVMPRICRSAIGNST